MGGVPWWCSRLRTLSPLWLGCHCYGLIPGLGTSTCHGRGQKKPHPTMGMTSLSDTGFTNQQMWFFAFCFFTNGFSEGLLLAEQRQ